MALQSTPISNISWLCKFTSRIRVLLYMPSSITIRIWRKIEVTDLKVIKNQGSLTKIRIKTKSRYPQYIWPSKSSYQKCYQVIFLAYLNLSKCLCTVLHSPNVGYQNAEKMSNIRYVRIFLYSVWNSESAISPILIMDQSIRTIALGWVSGAFFQRLFFSTFPLLLLHSIYRFKALLPLRNISTILTWQNFLKMNVFVEKSNQIFDMFCTMTFARHKRCQNRSRNFSCTR